MSLMVNGRHLALALVVSAQVLTESPPLATSERALSHPPGRCFQNLSKISYCFLISFPCQSSAVLTLQ